MDAHELRSREPVCHPHSCGGDQQVAAIRAMQPYTPPLRPHAEAGKPQSWLRAAPGFVLGAVLGLVFFATACALLWIVNAEIQDCTSRAAAPIVRGFEGG